MTEHSDLPGAWWANNLDELDQEIARLALVCGVRILEPGVVGRVLQRDESVCGDRNPLAFGKLHDLLMVHLAVREKTVDAIGQNQTAQIEADIFRRLKDRFAHRLGD